MIIHPAKAYGLLHRVDATRAQDIKRELEMSLADLRSNIDLMCSDVRQLEDFLSFELYGNQCRCASCQTLTR
jgi:hypothetical protein